MQKLKDNLMYLKRRYKNITPEFCFYNDPKELKQKTYSIIVHCLIENQSEHHGFILKATFNSVYKRDYKQWADYLTHSQFPKTKTERDHLRKRRLKKYPSIKDVLSHNIINNHYGKAWELKEIIGWQLFKGEKK